MLHSRGSFKRYLKIQVQECGLLAEHYSLGINLQQRSEILSHIKCHLPFSLRRFFSSDSPLEHVSLLLIHLKNGFVILTVFSLFRRGQLTEMVKQDLLVSGLSLAGLSVSLQ